MEFFDVLKTRRSVRAFKPAVPPKEKLDAILGAIRIAPSAGNVQAFKIRVVTDTAVKRALAKASFGQGFVAEAPWVIAFLTDAEASRASYGERGAQLYAVQDATIACAHAHLAAAAVGLGSVWVGAFSAAAVTSALGTPPEFVPVALLPVGTPAEEPKPTSRKTIEELVI